MARIDWVDARLQNWARWLASRGHGAMGYAGVNWGSMASSNAGRDGYVEAVIPTSDVEASETHGAVARLPSELRATIECVYLGTGTTRESCQRLNIAEQTLHKRVERAHVLLAKHWDAKRQAQQAERDRIEQLTEQSKPRGFYA